MLDIGFITLFAHTNERSTKFPSLRKLLLTELKLDSAYRFTKGEALCYFHCPLIESVPIRSLAYVASSLMAVLET